MKYLEIKNSIHVSLIIDIWFIFWFVMCILIKNNVRNLFKQLNFKYNPFKAIQ